MKIEKQGLWKSSLFGQDDHTMLSFFYLCFVIYVFYFMSVWSHTIYIFTFANIFFLRRMMNNLRQMKKKYLMNRLLCSFHKVCQSLFSSEHHFFLFHQAFFTYLLHQYLSTPSLLTYLISPSFESWIFLLSILFPSYSWVSMVMFMPQNTKTNGT